MMEKTDVLNTSKMENIKNKEKVAEKIESLWGENSFRQKKPKFESKKLSIKLETNGTEKRKIMLKMESESPNIHSSNYSLISELLREFFNGSSNIG